MTRAQQIIKKLEQEKKDKNLATKFIFERLDELELKLDTIEQKIDLIK